MTQHTHDRLALAEDNAGGGFNINTDERRRPKRIAHTARFCRAGREVIDDEGAKANAARLVDCWNACDGFKISEVESALASYLERWARGTG